MLWQNFIRTFNVPGRLTRVDSGHSPLRPLTLSGLCAVPATNTHAILRRGKVWPPGPELEPGSHHRHQRRSPVLLTTRPRRGFLIFTLSPTHTSPSSRLGTYQLGMYTRLQTVWSLPGHSRQANKGHSPRCHRPPTALVGSLIRSSNLPHSLQRGVLTIPYPDTTPPLLYT